MSANYHKAAIEINEVLLVRIQQQMKPFTSATEGYCAWLKVRNWVLDEIADHQLAIDKDREGEPVEFDDALARKLANRL